MVLNAAETIERTIKSVLLQDYDNIEYIIIDGESADGTLDIIEKYKENIAYFISEKDSGIYDAMNKGIRASSGDIIGIINADDWYEKHAVRKAVQALEEHDGELCCGDIVFVSKVESKRVSSNIEHDLMYGNSINHPTVFAKREVYDEIGLFDTKYRIAADYKWMTKAFLSKKKMVYIYDILAFFSDGGISSDDYKTVLESSQVIEDLLKEFHRDDLNEIKDYWKSRICKIKMNNITDKDYKDIGNYIRNKNIEKLDIVIWGAGKFGNVLVDICQVQAINVKHWVDADVNKQNKCYKGIVIEAPEVIKKRCFIIFAVNTSKVIQMQDSVVVSLNEIANCFCM